MLMDKVEAEKVERSDPSREGDKVSTDEGDRNEKHEKKKKKRNEKHKGQLAWQTGEFCLDGEAEIQVWKMLRA